MFLCFCLHPLSLSVGPSCLPVPLAGMMPSVRMSGLERHSWLWMYAVVTAHWDFSVWRMAFAHGPWSRACWGTGILREPGCGLISIVLDDLVSTLWFLASPSLFLSLSLSLSLSSVWNLIDVDHCPMICCLISNLWAFIERFTSGHRPSSSSLARTALGGLATLPRWGSRGLLAPGMQPCDSSFF